jgi:hypothetical protein
VIAPAVCAAKLVAQKAELAIRRLIERPYQVGAKFIRHVTNKLRGSV